MPWKRKVEIIAAYLWSPYQYIKSKYAGYEDYLRNDWCFSRIKLGGLKAKDIREGFLDHMDEMKIQRLKIKDLMKDFEVKPESDYYRNVYELVYLPSLNQYALLAYTTCGTKVAGYVLLLFTKKLKTALWLAPMLMHFKDEKIHPGEVMFFMADKESVVIEHFGIECKPKLILKDVKNAKHSLILRAEKVLKPDWSPKKND